MLPSGMEHEFASKFIAINYHRVRDLLTNSIIVQDTLGADIYPRGYNSLQKDGNVQGKRFQPQVQIS